MDKKAVDWKGIAKTTGEAALATGSVAAVVALIRQLAEARRQKKKEEQRQSNSISPDTIVLRVRKQAACSHDAGECPDPVVGNSNSFPKKPSVSKVEGPVEKVVRPVSNEKQLREVNGRFTGISNEKCAETFLEGVTSDTGKLLGALGGSIGGYMLVSRIAEKIEQNRLKKQIAAAQQEYLDLLEGNNKTAEAFATVFCMNDGTDELISEGVEKKAGIIKDTIEAVRNAKGGAQKLSASMLALALLGVGGTAYVTKKLLENRFDPPEEEKPQKQTRIVLASAEKDAEYEIEPDKFLATIGIMRDCIADSLPPGVKQAADAPDYSFIGDIANMDGGRQFILDTYAKQQGLKREPYNFNLPTSMLLRHGATISDINANPDKHRAGIQTYVMDMMQKDPKAWFDLLGSDRNKDLVALKANQQIENMDGQSGILGWLARVPVLGNIVKSIARWYMGTGAGSKYMARNLLNNWGINGQRADDMLSSYNFSNGGWTPAQQKVASLIGDMIAISSRTKTISDASNKEILAAINDLKAKKGKKKSDKKIVVEFSDDVKNMMPQEAMDRLEKILTA